MEETREGRGKNNIGTSEEGLLTSKASSNKLLGSHRTKIRGKRGMERKPEKNSGGAVLKYGKKSSVKYKSAKATHRRGRKERDSPSTSRGETTIYTQGK